MKYWYHICTSDPFNSNCVNICDFAYAKDDYEMMERLMNLTVDEEYIPLKYLPLSCYFEVVK